MAATVFRLALISFAQEVHPDVLVVLNVTGGVTPGKNSWFDSYSVGDKCYCNSTFDHNIGSYYVETPFGWLTVRQVCDLLGPGPGITDRPVYNDLQCGNGPPNDAGDEHVCPGRVDMGESACGHIGPKWNFSNLTNASVAMSDVPDDAHPDIRAVLNVTAGIVPNTTLADSYSVGDSCYCSSSFDDGIRYFYIDTPLGWKTVKEVCDLLGPGPGFSGRPVYNDLQCGNGPPSAAGDEHVCPGRVDIGVKGCGQIGPKWNFASFLTASPSAAPDPAPSLAPVDAPSMVPVDAPSMAPVDATSTVPVNATSMAPFDAPSTAPVDAPSTAPVDAPSMAPTDDAPTTVPTSGAQGKLLKMATTLQSIVSFILV